LRDTINPALVLAHARAWVGTPFVPRGDLRGAGADCIGLIRGLWWELAGRFAPAPAWRADWSAAPAEAILDGLARHVVRVPLAEVRPGHVITYRIGDKRAAHVAILTDEGAVHAWEVGGVKETAPLFGREITSAWALPCHPECHPGPLPLTAEDCLAVIYPDALGPYAEVSLLADGTPLARSGHYASTAAALAALQPIYRNVETVE
jgi:NlpC/P60 family putative phage cell wall peptidase